MLLDFLLMVSLGFLGSFGHCASMCGPLTVAFSLTTEKAGTDSVATPTQAGSDSAIWFHALLNLGRMLSYGVVGAGIGAVGEVLLAGGQMAGIGSELRRGMAIATGLLLLWLSLGQIAPGLLPKLPLFKLAQHERLSKIMVNLSLRQRFWTPLVLGLCWGLIPCGFLYTAQIRAAETGRWWMGALLMLAFGLGTAPTMLGIGWVAGRWSDDRRSQLFRLGGWVTLAAGLLLLWRTGDSHGGWVSAYGSLTLLMLALVARPVARWWTGLLQYRRGLGVGSFVLAIAHILHIFTFSWDWNWQAVRFLIPTHRTGVVLGLIALLLMAPAAVTSFDQLQKHWRHWRAVHLLTVPALGLAIAHTLMLDRRFGWFGESGGSAIATLGLIAVGIAVLGLRWLLNISSAKS